MRKLRNSLYVNFIILIFTSNCINAGGLVFNASILDFYPGKLPKSLIFTISNNSSNTASIYKPRDCFHFFWSAIVASNDSTSQEYLIRSDIPWKEPAKIVLRKGEKISDTVVLVPNSFFRKGCQEGCTPFRKSVKIAFKYEFKGMATVKANTQSVFIPDSNAMIKNKTTAGKWLTNEIAFPAVDFDKLQEFFVEGNFGIPLISIKENCCQ